MIQPIPGPHHLFLCFIKTPRCWPIRHSSFLSFLLGHEDKEEEDIVCSDLKRFCDLRGVLVIIWNRSWEMLVLPVLTLLVLTAFFFQPTVGPWIIYLTPLGAPCLGEGSGGWERFRNSSPPTKEFYLFNSTACCFKVVDQPKVTFQVLLSSHGALWKDLVNGMCVTSRLSWLIRCYTSSIL